MQYFRALLALAMQTQNCVVCGELYLNEMLVTFKYAQHCFFPYVNTNLNELRMFGLESK